MNRAELVRLLDRLEDQADGYVTLETVEAAAGEPVAAAIDEQLVLVDFRTRLDGTPVTVCRLNRRHPLVVQLTDW